MPFENSSATDPKDLLQQLVLFLVANGWTQDRSAIEGAGWTATLHNGAVYVHLRAVLNEAVPFKNCAGDLGYSISLYLGSGYSSGSPFNSQLIGSPIQFGGTATIGAVMQLLSTAITNYYFFADAGGANVAVVVEKSSGVYAHMGWGTSLAKIGTWTGGPYFFASSSAYGGHAAGNYTGSNLSAAAMGTWGDDSGYCSTFVRAAVDSFDGWVSVMSGGLGTGYVGYCGRQGASSVGGLNRLTPTQLPSYTSGWNAPGSFQNSLTSAIDGRANLLPCLLWALRDGTTTGFSPLGTIPNCFVCDGVGRGFSPGSDYAIGADTYTVFPNYAVKKTA